MYRTFEIKNFRCFDDLKLGNLARINLIGGKNNVGKTALLEALFIHSGIYNSQLTIRPNVFRGISKFQFQLTPTAPAPWDALFREFDTSYEIVFANEDDRGEHRVLRMRVLRDPKELREARLTVQQGTNGSSSASTSSDPIQVLRLQYEGNGQGGISHAIMDHEGLHHEIVPPPPFDFVFLAARGRPPLEEEADRFTNLIVDGKKNLLLDTLKILERRLTDVELLKFSGETVLWGHVENERTKPLFLMGDGMNRLASLVAAMGYAKNSYVFIDEIENGLHYTVLKDVWTAIGKAAREFNTQIFATTHSWECITAAHRAFSESEYDFRYHRLNRTKGENIKAVTYDQETMEGAIEIGMEVR
jgi:hypothetical protein